MGDSWISPMDSVNTWGPYLYATSVIDSEGLKKVSYHHILLFILQFKVIDFLPPVKPILYFDPS